MGRTKLVSVDIFADKVDTPTLYNFLFQAALLTFLENPAVMKLSLFCLLILSAVSQTKSYRHDAELDERSPVSTCRIGIEIMQ